MSTSWLKSQRKKLNRDQNNILITKLRVNLDFQVNKAEIWSYNTPKNGKLFYLCVVTER